METFYNIIVEIKMSKEKLSVRIVELLEKLKKHIPHEAGTENCSGCKLEIEMQGIILEIKKNNKETDNLDLFE